MSLVTQDERWAMYRRIFETIPPSILAPDHPHNRAIVGAIAYACAYVEKQFGAFEAGLSLSTASGTDVGSDGLTSLARWGLWLETPQIFGESSTDYRQRLMRRLFTARLTQTAITSAITAATGLVCTIELPSRQLFTWDAEGWDRSFLMGDRYAPMSIDVITEGQTDVPRAIVPKLRAAEVHWRHIERASYETVLSWKAQQASVMQGFDWAPLEPGHPVYDLDFDDSLPEPSTLATASSSSSLDHAIHWGAGVTMMASPIGATEQVVEASYVPDGLPVFTWDNAATLWGESVWGN